MLFLCLFFIFSAGKEQARKVEVGDNDLPAEYLNSDLAKEQQVDK